MGKQFGWAALAGMLCLGLLTDCATDPTTGTVEVKNPLTNPKLGPPAGNPAGTCPIPTAAGLVDVSIPDQVVGTGTLGSCTEEAFISAVAKGGIITFNCGPDTAGRFTTMGIP